MLVPYQGILQGDGAVPTTQVDLSTPLLNMMRTVIHWGFFTSPISGKNLHYVSFAYVDDTAVLEYKSQDPNILIDEVMEDMQQTVDCWEGGLKAAGGVLVPSKSWAYPVSLGLWKPWGNRHWAYSQGSSRSSTHSSSRRSKHS